MKLHEMRWPELAQVDREDTLILASIGACEQHGPHLPTFTDTLTAEAIADGVEARLADQVLMLPVMWLGASEHHLPFGATLTARVETHITLLIEMVGPLLEDGFRRLMFLNAHGGNTDTMRVALRRMQRNHPDALLTGAGFWELAQAELAEICDSPQSGPIHACEVETSIMLALRPDLVGDIEGIDFDKPTAEDLRGLYISQDIAQSTEKGLVGYPSFATADKGRRFLAAAIDRTVEVAEALLEEQLPEIRLPGTDLRASN